ncbi:MAG: hypothetical protein JSW07_05745, partial [bacterium]
MNHRNFIDWIRGDVGSHFKKKDSFLMPNRLLKIDLSALSESLEVEKATLYMYTLETFRPEITQTLNLYVVEDDTWSSDRTTTQEIYQWPISQGLASYPSGQKGWKIFNITESVQKSCQQQNRILSLKWGVNPLSRPSDQDILVSPSWDLSGKLDGYDNSNLKSFVKVLYCGPKQLPDLYVDTSDLWISHRWAMPG